MAKRFTDTEKWDRQWFEELSPNLKLFWIYLLDKCNNAGIWHVNMKRANYSMGTRLTEKSVLEAFPDRIQVVAADKWLVIKFIPYQYGKLSPERSNIHKGVLKSLVAAEVNPNPFLTLPVANVKEMERDQGKDKALVKEKVKDLDKGNRIALTPDTVVNLWNSAMGAKLGYCKSLGANKHLKNFLDAVQFLNTEKSWLELFELCDQSDFLSGRTERGDWRASLTWLVDYDNALRVLNGEFKSGADTDALFALVRQEQSA